MAFDTRTYRRALEAQTRRIDDYQRVHFRKSSTPKIYDTVTGFEQTQDSRNPERPFLQPRVVEFSRATAKAFLQQTESLWLKLDLSRQDATKDLLDRKTGSFFVRSSTKAKYALTVRLEDNNPPVTHFIVHCNDQGFYIIQGSNLQFVSLYDLLAFFCFQQSGGMPCLLRPPVARSKRDNYLLESDDSESEEEEEWENGESISSISSPPQTPAQYDEIRFRPALTSQQSLQPYPVTVPPPLPPRRRPQISSYFDVSQDMLDRANRVSSLVDNDTGALIETLERNNRLLERPHRTKEESTPPTPFVNESRNDPDLTVRQSYKNFQIMSEYSSSYKRISGRYEMAPAIKEIVTPIFSTPPQTDNQPPAIPPKALPPPIPPKSIHKDTSTNIVTPSTIDTLFPSTIVDTPPPLPPKLKTTYEITKPRAFTHFSSESEVGRRLVTSSRLGHRRASSDSSIISGLSEEVTGPVSPPPLPPNHPRETEDVVENFKQDKMELETKEGWTFVEKSELSDVFDRSDMSPPTTPSTNSSSNTPAKIKWKKPRWAKKLKKWRRKPRSKVKSYILDLSKDTNSVFGARIHYFIETVLMRSDPHQKLFSDVRMFMGKMRELLLTDYKVDLLGEGMDSCQNFEHLLESTLQQCIISPLNSFLYTRLKENLVQNGSFCQVKNAINNALTKTPEELGIRGHLLVPNEKSLQEINNIFTKLKDSYNAMRKMEYLLEAVRLTYEAVRDANNPKKAMHDLGADDFLPLFVWVLAHSNFDTAEVEAEYVWGLAHPSLFNGEGGYYLTTLTSAVNVLKECCSCDDSTDYDTQDIPNMNSLKTQLPIAVQDPSTGKIGPPTSIPVLPTMTISEICDVISSQYNVPSSETYGLYKRIDNTVTRLNDTDCPQEMNIDWELQSEPRDNIDRPILVYMKE